MTGITVLEEVWNRGMQRREKISWAYVDQKTFDIFAICFQGQQPFTLSHRHCLSHCSQASLKEVVAFRIFVVVVVTENISFVKKIKYYSVL